MGVSYKGGTFTYHSLDDNQAVLLKKFSHFQDGYFGEQNNRNEAVRNYTSDDPLKTGKEFYDTAANGGKEEPIYDKKTGKVIGRKTEMKDGTIIVFREKSSSDGSPVIEIFISKRDVDKNGKSIIKEQKIHFEDTKGE